ncbi:hypothetical protein C8J56DRAFT_342204 [Mycena floridula]|nr:hypothetical protein C8J56DRAFT_342204 [Mycena floridula]
MAEILKCVVCEKTGDNATLNRCSGCHSRVYCGRECQEAEWPAHKGTCKSISRPRARRPVWYDKYRRCQDGRDHEGRLELITWSGMSDGDAMGWGNMFAEESDEMKRKFENEMGGDEETFYKDWPQGFRWTCCGTDAGMDWGCDHHGWGCTCDYCRSGEPIPDDLYDDKSPTRMGLNLSRGRGSRR